MEKTVVLIGGGGREHAIAAALRRSSKVGKIYAIPGNAGIRQVAECVEGDVMDFAFILEFCRKVKADYVFVSPDDPLAGGLVDILIAEGIKAFGPVKDCAVIESSKVFSKNFMKKHNIPTADYEVFEDYSKALEYVAGADYPLVIKADGLALGKGVIICRDYKSAEEALKSIMLDKVFKDAGRRVVAEEYLTGHEVSLLIFCDGEHYKLMPSSQDYKKAFDGDKGLNTGGMGAVSPSPYFTEDVRHRVIKEIVEPTVRGLSEEGRIFKGVLYFGLMLTEKGPKVLEYNARFGDPETQVILPKLKTDLIDIMEACISGTLDKTDIEWEECAAVTVVAASDGYPGKVIKGIKIVIVPVVDTFIYHSGTVIRNNELLTNGGRVLSVCAKGRSIEQAREKAYEGIEGVYFAGMQYRHDIALFTEKEHV